MYLVTAAEMRALDRRAVEMGIPALLLMENAGKAVAAETAALLLERRMPDLRESAIAVLAGPGQNGGDGLCAARHLSSMGYRVEVGLFGAADRLPPEARANYDALCAYGVEILEVGISPEMTPDAVLARLTGAGAIVDALLGIGQEGDPRPPIDAAVRWANRQHEAGTPVIACDVPTGLDSDTGAPFDPVVSASATVTMGLPKIGLYSFPGRRYAGRVVVETLGLPQALLGKRFPAKAVFAGDARQALPRRLADHHKGLSGHVTVIAGSLGMSGAAVLAAKAALRAGAGTVTLLCPGQVYQVCASMAQEVMVLPCGVGPTFLPDAQSVSLATDFARRSSCIAIGPGFGRGDPQVSFLREVLPEVSSLSVPCLIDADGLYAVGELGGLSYVAGLGGKFILTPHPGELARLTGVEARVIGRDRAFFARKSALQHMTGRPALPQRRGRQRR